MRITKDWRERAQGVLLRWFRFLTPWREWLSFQAYTVCTQSRERACGSDLIQVSLAVPTSQGREEGLKRVTREGRLLLSRGFPGKHRQGGPDAPL